jgi:hypothetical protein
MDDRWTIRRVAEDARVMIEEVHGMTGIPYGRLVSEAIRVWFDLLDREPTLPAARILTRWTTEH